MGGTSDYPTELCMSITNIASPTFLPSTPSSRLSWSLYTGLPKICFVALHPQARVFTSSGDTPMVVEPILGCHVSGGDRCHDAQESGHNRFLCLRAPHGFRNTSAKAPHGRRQARRGERRHLPSWGRWCALTPFADRSWRESTDALSLQSAAASSCPPFHSRRCVH